MTEQTPAQILSEAHGKALEVIADRLLEQLKSFGDWRKVPNAGSYILLDLHDGELQVWVEDIATDPLYVYMSVHDFKSDESTYYFSIFASGPTKNIVVDICKKLHKLMPKQFPAVL